MERNKLSFVDFTTNTSLKLIEVGQNELTSINLNNNTELETLSAHNNLIRSINLNKHTKLKELYLSSNFLTTLDVRNCSLRRLSFYNNPNIKTAFLTNQPFKTIVEYEGFNDTITINNSVFFKDCPKLEFICIDAVYTAEAEARKTTPGHSNYTVSTNCSLAPPTGCQIINFPDPNFKQALINHTPVIDTDGDGEICTEEAEAATNIILYKKNITDVTGIRFFKNITQFYSELNLIENLSFLENKKLKYLILRQNPLINLDITNNLLLESIEASNGNLKTLDINNNALLKNLDLNNNQITNLDISKNNKLETLWINFNKLTSIEITANNSKLKNLFISHNLIKEIDISKISSILTLRVSNNPLLEKAFLKGGHLFYPNFNPSFLQLQNSPKLKFICIDPVSTLNFNSFENFLHNTLGYTSLILSTDCNNTTPIFNFNSFFSLSPNPTTGAMWLKRNSAKISASLGSIYNAQTGAFVKSVPLFKGGLLSPFKTTIKKLEPIGTNNSVLINVSDLQNGNYILVVHSSLGDYSTKFIRSTLGHF